MDVIQCFNLSILLDIFLFPGYNYKLYSNYKVKGFYEKFVFHW